MQGKFLTSVCILFAAVASAAPDEDQLGKQRGYPIGEARNWFFDESVRVGSFSAQGEIPNIFGGKPVVLQPAKSPMALPKTAKEPYVKWQTGTERNLTIDDYMARQRVMGLLVIKDGVVQVERYQYDRTPSHRFVSQSMAKSIVSLAVGIALRDGKIRSLDDAADAYAPDIAGTLYGGTTIRNLLRMASGARFVEDYTGKDDLARFSKAALSDGIAAGAKVITERANVQGTKFNYASVETEMLAEVLRGATSQSLSDYVAERLWKPIGAESSALWRADHQGKERAAGNFNATLRDYGRLGIVLANDGTRPDDPSKTAIIPRDYLLDATDWHSAPEVFRPGKATPYFGYGYQFWTFPGERRRFAMLGVYGQAIFVDPQLKLVMVHVSANATARSGQTTLGAEMDALWRGLVRHYGYW